MSRDSGSDGPTRSPNAGRGSDRRQQQAGFSIFVDHVVDPRGRPGWETRLYHAESGVEATLAGADPREWIAWLLERLGRGEIVEADQQPAPAHAKAEVRSVEILDVMVGEQSSGDNESLYTVRARVVAQFAGVDRVEREIGSQILRGIAARWASNDTPPSVT